jgi:pimeloyl-ACP methyl ester carboxylesterase
VQPLATHSLPHKLTQSLPHVNLDMLQIADVAMQGAPISVTDVLEAVHQLGLRQAYCFGHSLGGNLALAAEVVQPGLWKALCVFEPPITMTVEQVCRPRLRIRSAAHQACHVDMPASCCVIHHSRLKVCLWQTTAQVWFTRGALMALQMAHTQRCSGACDA